MRYVKDIVFVGVSLVALSTSAFAQDRPTQATGQPGAASDAGEIIVTARRRSESAQDVPLVVSAVTSEALDKLAIRNATDVASVVPGLTLAVNPNGIGGIATLRGVNFNVSASGNNGTVEFYLNDQSVAANVVLTQMFDVQQIEVLHGPQGTLRGRASPSGSITVTTRTPDLNEVGGYFSGTATDIGGINGQGAVNLPLIKGKLALRVAAVVDDNESNRVHSINAPSISPFSRTRSERATLRFDLFDNLDIIGTYQHLVTNSQQFDQAESANILNPALPASPVNITAGERESVENIQRINRFAFNDYNIRAEWRFAGQKLNYVGAWDDQHYFARAPSSNDEGNFFGANGYPGNASAANDPFSTGLATVPNLLNAAQFSATNSRQESHELRLSSDERLFGIADYVIGGMIDRTVTPTNVWSETPVFRGIPSPTTPYGYAVTNVFQFARQIERSVFGNVTLHLGRSTELSGGLRYIHYEANSAATLTSAQGSAPLGAPIQTSGHPVIYSVSLKHRFNDNIMAYVSTGSSWRASAQTNTIIDRANIYPYGYLAALHNLSPETSKSYEVGIKSEWLDRRLTADLTYYHQDFSNYFYSSPNIVAAQRTAIVDGTAAAPGPNDAFSLGKFNLLAVDVPVKVNGVEGDFAFRASPDWNIGATFSYSFAKIQNGVIPCNLNPVPTTPAALLAATGGEQVATCSANGRAGVSPPFSAAVRSEYSHSLSNNVDGFVRGLLNYYGAAQSDPGNPTNNFGRVPSYALLNLFLGVHDAHGAWEITGYVKNLFNVQRVLAEGANPLATSAQVGRTGTLLTTTYREIGSMTPPREMGVTVRYSFGSR